MNQWTKVDKIMNWINDFAKEYKNYSFWYMNNHELKFSIGNYIYLVSYDDKLTEISLQIYNNNQECIYRHSAYIALHYNLTMGAIIQGIIEAFILGLNAKRCKISKK